MRASPRMIAALALCALAPEVSADPAVHLTSPPLDLTLPPRATARPAEHPTPDNLGTWELHLADDAPVLLQLARLGAPLPQRALTDEELSALRSADPYPFTDRVNTVSALGFDVPALEGRATVMGHTLVRFAAALPLTDEGVLVVVMAPEVREREARVAWRAVLASARGRTAWLTSAQRLRARVQGGAAVWALAAMAAYAALAWTRWRGGRGGRARTVLVASVAAAWALVAMLAPQGARGAQMRAVVMAAVFAHHAWRTARRDDQR